MHLGAEVHADAAPTLKAVGAGGALGHASALVVVVHAGGARRVAARQPAAAQALGVAAPPLQRTRSPPTLLWTLWRTQKTQT